MCGIFCSLSRHSCQLRHNEKLLKNRGPDSYNVLESTHYDWNVLYVGSTLWTQGFEIKSQPLIHPDGSILLWNGDKYTDNTALEPGNSSIKNDSEEVLSRLVKGDIYYFGQITGPYAFIFYHSKKKELWFGRDVLGRHSLLWFISQKNIVLSSVALEKSSDVLTEVPSCGLYKISLSPSNINVDLFPWSHMMPKEIQISVPFNVKDVIYHNTLGKSTDYFWTILEPVSSELVVLLGETSNDVFSQYLKNPMYMNEVDKLRGLLFKSVKKRIHTKPNLCKDCVLNDDYCKHAKIGILFSGGLDSAILALISNYFVPEDEPIDLYNVCFAKDKETKYDSVPDRKTGRRTLLELRALCPKRVWNFVEINVTQEELQSQRKNHIVNLISPLNSVLDDSLGCALWFAARGKGSVDEKAYFSPCRVVLLGMGADELFGGYSRHRVTYKAKGWKGLARDLYSDLRNIGERNLGRDNRVVADHGRQPRMPYLDEDFVATVDSIPTWIRCSFHPKMPRGIGDKLLLRLLAWNLGLRAAASEPKKALQFGSRIANPKEKGHLKSEHLAT